jgi:hypothetical protein
MRPVAATILVLALCAVPGVSMADGGQAKRESCGKYSSASIYAKAKVIAIRGVDCAEARKVAKKYDHKGVPKGKWQCFLAHGGGRRLFSCGYGGSQGDVRDFPHALIAKGVGQPDAMAGQD